MHYVDNQSDMLRPLLTEFPELVNDVTTGGAQPLHMCGMSSAYQDAASMLIEFGADIEALDTYGMTPLHRMVSKEPVGLAVLRLGSIYAEVILFAAINRQATISPTPLHFCWMLELIRTFVVRYVHVYSFVLWFICILMGNCRRNSSFSSLYPRRAFPFQTRVITL